MKRVMIQAEAELLERARRTAERRGVTFPQLVRDAIERELVGEAVQPPLTSVGAFGSGAGDLSRRADAGEYEPEPFR